ncbi:hypothetical protein [Bradyrhizobium sp. CB3481]|uniref:hypothetical protein n=1 Tax=Bradyrhizobium sp. CB3481 TaxID=3039158 RepID=UPI0024B0D096|nr:hypothetical protein [Bradyrhizobium sp. CB3481]WFU16650.1 hypothetical protein QA643_37935 [Bradyrhizobium sp. CB3481]
MSTTMVAGDRLPPFLLAKLGGVPAKWQATDNLKRDEIGLNRHRALALCLSMIFSENRCTLFRIML